MNNYNKLINNLETLKLIKIKDSIDNYIDLVNNKKKDFVDSLYELTKLELGALEEKRTIHAIQFAGFPYYKCLDER